MTFNLKELVLDWFTHTYTAVGGTFSNPLTDHPYGLRTRFKYKKPAIVRHLGIGGTNLMINKVDEHRDYSSENSSIAATD